jgi:hypothetical protein
LHPIKQLKEQLKKVLRLPKNIQPFSLVTVGYPRDNISNNRIPSRFDKNKMHYNRW